MKELNKLVEALYPQYGALGSRDVDVTASRRVIDESAAAIAEAFRALEQRAEAAEAKLALVREQRDSELNRNTELEAKLAELQKQEPIGYVSDSSAYMAANGRLGYISNHQVAGLLGRYVYARPAPAVSLGDLVPEERPVKEDEFLSEYLPQQPHYTEIFNLGWKACRAAILLNIEKL